MFSAKCEPFCPCLNILRSQTQVYKGPDVFCGLNIIDLKIYAANIVPLKNPLTKQFYGHGAA